MDTARYSARHANDAYDSWAYSLGPNLTRRLTLAIGVENGLQRLWVPLSPFKVHHTK